MRLTLGYGMVILGILSIILCRLSNLIEYEGELLLDFWFIWLVSGGLMIFGGNLIYSSFLKNNNI